MTAPPTIVGGRSTNQSNALNTVQDGPASRRHPLVLEAPLTLLFLGAPLWWVLGLFQAAFFVASALMGLRLLRRTTISVPRGFGIWLLFLVWLIGGLFVLQVDAPGAVPGQSTGRYLTFSYRLGWYVIAGVAALYVLNTKGSVSSDRICSAISWFFVALVGGGLLGILRPEINFSSLLEIVLPNQLTRHQFVIDLIHPSVAQVHDFLGHSEARPSAPFAYTNDWGMAVALTLPFFVLVWWRRGGIWRWAMAVTLVVAAIPVISSLNRGLWVAIAAVAIFTAVRAAFLGQLRLLAVLVVALIAATLAIALSPMGALVQARLDTPHSDEGRTNLSTQAVLSTLEGSPVVGFGSTRDVAGNFTSIAGGATEECPACSPPPLGTHGQAWMLIFATGFGGFLLFTAFVGTTFMRHLRSPVPTAPASLACLLVLLVTMPIYESVGVALFIGFIAIGLLARDVDNSTEWAPTMTRLVGPVRRGAWIVVVAVLVGSLLGLTAHQLRGQPARAAQSVLVPAIDMVSEPGARPLSMDSEAELVTSAVVIASISAATDTDEREVLERLSIGAEPNTRVLTISYVDSDAERAIAAVDSAVDGYLALREQLHIESQESIDERAIARYQTLNATLSTVQSLPDSSTQARTSMTGTNSNWLRAQIVMTLAGLQPSAPSMGVGEPVSDVIVDRSADAFLVWLGSGVSVGAVGGLSFAWRIGDRRRRPAVERHRNRIGLPVVLETGSIPGDGEDLQAACLELRTYLPLCGILSDAQSPSAVEFAERMDPILFGGANRSGNRALLVASQRSQTESLLRLRAWCYRMGIEAVGLIVVDAKVSEKGALR